MDDHQPTKQPLNSANEKEEATKAAAFQASAVSGKVNSSQPNSYRATTKTEQGSFVKLAMRNMVKKGGTSLFHFFLTIVGVIGTLVGLAIAFH
jgi:hypothetical protein